MMLQGDRMVYISTGEAARERMTDSDCDKVCFLQALALSGCVRRHGLMTATVCNGCRIHNLVSCLVCVVLAKSVRNRNATLFFVHAMPVGKSCRGWQVIATMIPLLRAHRYDLAVQKGVQGIVKAVAGPRTWWRRHANKVPASAPHCNHFLRHTTAFYSSTHTLRTVFEVDLQLI